MTRINHHVLSIPDKAALAAHLVNIQATGGLFYENEKDFARQMAAALPGYWVMRSYPDANHMKDFTPKQWLARHSALGDGGLYVQTVNEPGWSPELVNWHIELLQEKKRTNNHVRVSLPGLPAGTPGLDQWSIGEKLFKLMADMRDEVAWNFHQYMAGIPTTGFIGGAPDHAGKPIGEPGGQNFIPLVNWPLDTRSITKFHMGREFALYAYWKTIGIGEDDIPVVIGETGSDYLSDIGAWIRTLISDSGKKDTPDGWREWFTQWRSWYGNIDPAELYMMMFAYLDRHVIHPAVKAVFIYAYGLNPAWAKYRTDDTKFIEHLEHYATGRKLYLLPNEPWNAPDTTPLPPSVPPPPIPVPAPPEKPDEPPLVPSPLTRKWCLEMSASHSALEAVHSLLAKRWKALADSLPDDLQDVA